LKRTYEVTVEYIPIDGEGRHYGKRRRKVVVMTHSSEYGSIREAVQTEIDNLLIGEFGKGSEGQLPQAVGLEIKGRSKLLDEE